MSEQAENIERVRSSIGSIVAEFIRKRIRSGKLEFVIAELSDYVRDARGGAPASPDRILRDGRQRGEFNYVVVNRRESRYRIVPMPPKEASK